MSSFVNYKDINGSTLSLQSATSVYLLDENNILGNNIPIKISFSRIGNVVVCQWDQITGTAATSGPVVFPLPTEYNPSHLLYNYGIVSAVVLAGNNTLSFFQDLDVVWVQGDPVTILPGSLTWILSV
jgi:hypothetical protein